MSTRIVAAFAALCAAAGVEIATTPAAAQELAPFQVEGGEIRAPLTATPGDAARGREVVAGREEVSCLICHSLPGTEAIFKGDLGPSLAGVGARFSAARLRLWLVDAKRIAPNTIMPSYYKVDGLHQVAARYRGKPILDAQQIEDAVAYLSTLKEPAK